MKSKYWILLCALLILSVVSVRSNAQTVASFGFSGYCYGFPTQLYNSSQLAYPIVSYNWDLNNDSIFTDDTGSLIQHNFAAGTYRVGLKVITVGDSAITYNTFVIQQSNSIFAINSDSQCLKNNNFIFTNTSTLAPSGTKTYLWDFGDGVTDTAKNISHSYTLQNKTYDVTLITTSDQGCKDTLIKKATIHPFPQVFFTALDTLICKNFVDTFANKSSINPGTLQYMWDFGDGNQTNTPTGVHSYLSYGTFPVKLTATSIKGCIDSFKLNVHVDTTLYASFKVNKDSQCMNGNSYLFTNTSDYCGTIDSTVWDLNGDGIFKDAKGNIVNSIYTTSGNRSIGMIVYNGFQKDTAYHTIVVLPSPNPDFTINNPIQNFALNYFVFTSTSTITPSSVLKLNWYFGDGGTSFNNPAGYSYLVANTFPVKLVVTSNKGCKDSIIKSVIVLNPLIVDFSADTICGIDSTTFTNKSSSVDPIQQVNWDFNNDNIFTDASGNKVKHLFSPGVYTVGLEIITTTDTAKILKQVVVYPKPVAGFTVNKINQSLTGNNFVLNNTTYILPLRTINYLWDFDDTKTSTQPIDSHTYAAIGSYRIKLTATSIDGCKDTISLKVNVLSNITLAANFTSDTVCFDQVTTLTNTSVSNYPILNFNWDLNNDGLFDNGTGSIFKTKFTAGKHSVGLQVITAYDTNEIYKDVIVYPTPRTDFMINRSTQPLKGNNFVFTNATLINPYSELTFEWTYGDGGTSFSIDGAHSYSAISSYDVRLIAISDKGCRDTVTKKVYLVNSNLTIDFTFNKTCIGDTTFFENPTTVTNDSIIKYIWDFDDGSPTVTGKKTNHLYAAAGKYDVSLIVVLVSGTQDTLIKSVDVNSNPVVTINFNPDSIIYTGQTATLSVTGQYDSILWSTGSKNSSIDVTNEGIYSVNVIDVNGCKGSESARVIILPKKAIDVVTGFTPNGDGINDYWRIINIAAFGKCNVTIYNRWGDEVYSNSDYKNDWDGKRNGKYLPQGTYYYMIKTPSDGTYTGPVNIVK